MERDPFPYFTWKAIKAHHACIKVVQCRDSGICHIWAQNLSLLMGGNKNGTATVWIITCIQRYTHFHGQKDTHKHTNTHNRKSVSEWEEAGRLAGAVLVEDMASVHLSISKHSVIFPLHRRRGHFFILFSSASHSFPHFCFSPLLQPSLLTHLSTPHLSFTSFPHSLYLFSAFSCFSFSTPPFSSPSPPSSAPCRLLRSQWNSPFSNKTKLPTASHTG